MKKWMMLILLVLVGCTQQVDSTPIDNQLHTLDDARSHYRVFIDTYTKKAPLTTTRYLEIDQVDQKLYKADLMEVYENIQHQAFTYELTNDLYHAFIRSFDNHLDDVDLSQKTAQVTIDPFGTSGVITINLSFDDHKLEIDKRYTSNTPHQDNIYEYFIFSMVEGLVYFEYSQLTYDQESSLITSMLSLKTLENTSVSLIYHDMRSHELIYYEARYLEKTSMLYVKNQQSITFIHHDYKDDFGYKVILDPHMNFFLNQLVMYFYQDGIWLLTVDQTGFYRFDFNLMVVQNWDAILFNEDGSIAEIHTPTITTKQYHGLTIINQIQKPIPFMAVIYTETLSNQVDLSRFGMLFTHVNFQDINHKEDIVKNRYLDDISSYHIVMTESIGIPGYDELLNILSMRFLVDTTSDHS